MYNIQKFSVLQTKDFLLNIDIPDYIYGKSEDDKYWFSAEGKNGLYNFKDSIKGESCGELIWLGDSWHIIRNHSLLEVYKILLPINYYFEIGFLKKIEPFLFPHPISGKVTEWDPESALEICKKLNKRIPELESVIAKDAQFSWEYAAEVIKGTFELADSKICEKINNLSLNYNISSTLFLK